MNTGRVLSKLTKGITGKPAWPVNSPRCKPIPPKLYRIGEIVEYTGLSRQTVHNYTIMGLITEARRSAGGHRLYDESVFQRLDTIEELKRQRKTMREIRRHFADLGDL